MTIHSLLREVEYAALTRIELSRSVLDLGGSKKSGYQPLFRGSYSITTLNLDPSDAPDIVHDLVRSQSTITHMTPHCSSMCLSTSLSTAHCLPNRHARRLGKKYAAADYALGYCLTARKL
jgi:hypothetical protein